MAYNENENPFRMMYVCLWDILEDSADFCAMVKQPNRIKYFSRTDRYPDNKDTLSNADFPQVKILVRGSPPNEIPKLNASSDSAIMSLRWEIVVATGDQRAITELDLAWVIYRAMSNWTTRLHALKWRGSVFVGAHRIREILTDLEDRKSHKGTLGWTSVWTADTELHFTTTELQKET